MYHYVTLTVRAPERSGKHLKFGHKRAHVWSHDGGNRRLEGHEGITVTMQLYLGPKPKVTL